MLRQLNETCLKRTSLQVLYVIAILHSGLLIGQLASKKIERDSDTTTV